MSIPLRIVILLGYSGILYNVRLHYKTLNSFKFFTFYPFDGDAMFVTSRPTTTATTATSTATIIIIIWTECQTSFLVVVVMFAVRKFGRPVTN